MQELQRVIANSLWEKISIKVSSPETENGVHATRRMSSLAGGVCGSGDMYNMILIMI